MDFKQSMKPGVVLSEKPNLIIIIGVFVLGLVLGGLLTGIYFKVKMTKAKSECTQKTAEAQKTGVATGAPEVPKALVPNEIYNVSGLVEKIDGNTLTVKSFSFGEQKSFTVKVTDNTKIIKRELLTTPPKAEEGKPISPFKETDAKLSDIRENDNINVEASENIKDKTEFEAKTVYIEIQNMPVPAPPTIDNSKVPPAPAAPPAPPKDIPIPPSTPPAPPADVPSQ